MFDTLLKELERMFKNNSDYNKGLQDAINKVKNHIELIKIVNSKEFEQFNR